MTVPYTFGSTPFGTNIPLSQLDDNFNAVGSSENISFLQSGTGAVVRTVQSKLREIVSPRDFGAVGNGVADDTLALQAFFNYAAANTGDYTYDWSGEWNISSTVAISGDNNEYICGSLFCTASMDVALTVAGINCNFNNHIRVYGNTKGTSLINYSSRNVTSALVDVLACGRTRFDGFIVEGSKRDGVRCFTSTYNSISANLGRVEARNCGSASPYETPEVWNIQFSFTNRTDTGNSGGTNQRSVLNVPSIPSELRVNDVVRLSNEFYQVTAIDTIANTVSVFPWIFNLATTSGTMFSCHGSGLLIDGANAAGIIVEGINSLRCGVAFYSASLYGSQTQALIAQVCSIGIGFRGQNTGFTIAGFHPEISDGSAAGILVIGSTDVDNAVISGISVYRPYDIDMMVALTSAGAKVYRPSFLTLVDGIGGAVSKQALPFSTAANANVGNTSSSILSNRPGFNTYISNRTSGSFNVFLTYDENYDRLFGYKVIEIYQATQNATGGGMAITIQPTTADAASGIKVMNGASYTIPLTSNARKIYAVYESVNKNWVIVLVEGNLTYIASATYNPPSISANSTATTTVSVVGASLGDYVQASFSQPLTSIFLSAYVSAADTVTVVFYNASLSPIDLLSGTLRVKVTKP